jgi:hypothetical protein
LLGLVLQLQLVFLLLQLLNDGVVKMEWQSIKLGGRPGIEFGLLRNAAAQGAHYRDCQHERHARREEGKSGAENKRIGEQPYHHNLPYQFKN